LNSVPTVGCRAITAVAIVTQVIFGDVVNAPEPPRVKAFAEAVRGHWSIKNNLHWVLDVAFREDDCRVRKDHGPENLGLVRRIAQSLLKRAPTRKKVGTACKRKQAGWDDDFLVEVLLGQPE